ncbi:TlpA family protein disulfide reductase [Congregibacter sp.]|uniref:TlpA family protein disulfide reductase n=1 Tax=Congregibacter sp. TaxID=2744308 RepID=UPI003F6BB8B8
MADAERDQEKPSPRRKWRRRAVESLFFASLFYGVLTWQTREMLPPDGSTNIPPFSLKSLDKATLSVAPDPRRETLIYFFAPWCGICRATVGHLKVVDPDTTQLIVIALDYASTDAVREFVEDTGLSQRVLLGTEATRNLFSVQGYPTYYTLDSDFRVTGRAMGALTAIGLRLR